MSLKNGPTPFPGQEKKVITISTNIIEHIGQGELLATFSYFLLKKQEITTCRVFTGAIFIVIGGVLISPWIGQPRRVLHQRWRVFGKAK